VIVLSASEPPPFGPGVALVLAVVFFGAAYCLVRIIWRAYDRGHPSDRQRSKSRPPWWRIRVIGARDMTLVPLVFFSICAGLSMIGYALFLWTGLDAFGIVGGVIGIAAAGCLVWAFYDRYGPPVWGRQERDEYRC
jgi:hypothetical protein